jgi:hypothetical protein
MYTVDWLAVARIELRCAELERDLCAQAAARLSLALLDWKQSRYPQAIEHYMLALKVIRRAYGPNHAESLAGRLPDRIDLGNAAHARLLSELGLAVGRRGPQSYDGRSGTDDDR